MGPLRAFQVKSLPVEVLVPSVKLATTMSLRVWHAPPGLPKVSPAAVELHQISKYLLEREP
jgi:hypothetical protein